MGLLALLGIKKKPRIVIGELIKYNLELNAPENIELLEKYISEQIKEGSISLELEFDKRIKEECRRDGSLEDYQFLNLKSNGKCISLILNKYDATNYEGAYAMFSEDDYYTLAKIPIHIIKENISKQV